MPVQAHNLLRGLVLPPLMPKSTQSHARDTSNDLQNTLHYLPYALDVIFLQHTAGPLMPHVPTNDRSRSQDTWSSPSIATDNLEATSSNRQFFMQTEDGVVCRQLISSISFYRLSALVYCNKCSILTDIYSPFGVCFTPRSLLQRHGPIARSHDRLTSDRRPTLYSKILG